MNAPLSEWLALREPADAAARSLSLTRTIAGRLASYDPVRILDLATGTGANLRYLVEHLPHRQRWLVTDVNPSVLSRLHERTAGWAVARGYVVTMEAGELAIRGERLDCRIAVRRLDLNALPPDIFSGQHLVTASALLDLVSESWLRTLAGCCRAQGVAALFALNYDGRSFCSPAEPEDDLLREHLNRHQRTDKGLGGTAAGPDATHLAVRLFEEAGYRARREQTDWKLGTEYAQLQRHLMEGWADATIDVDPTLVGTVAGWKERRFAHLDAGRSSVVVGHYDIGAWLP